MRSTGRSAFRSLVLALALMLSGPVLAAGFSCAQPDEADTARTQDELDEVVITGEQITTRTSDLQAWLRRLAGQYTYEGYVDLCGKGNAADQRPVTGMADCASSPSSPIVHCTVHARWPEARGDNGIPVLGGVSNLMPALVSYSLEPRYIPGSELSEAAFQAAIRTGIPAGALPTSRWGLMFTQLDNRGIAEWGSGELVGDTFTSREPCVGIETADTCQKIVRITASPDSNEIAMLVDIRIHSRRVLRQAFLLRRESNRQPSGQSGESSP